MQSSIARRARPLVLAAAVAAALAGPPAHAGQRADEMSLEYSEPRVSADGRHVSWQWTVKNASSAEVLDVQLVNRLEPRLKVTRVQSGCALRADTVQCAYGRMAAGAQQTGTVEVELPTAERGQARISGRLTWRPAVSQAQQPQASAPAG